LTSNFGYISRFLTVSPYGDTASVRNQKIYLKIRTLRLAVWEYGFGRKSEIFSKIQEISKTKQKSLPRLRQA